MPINHDVAALLKTPGPPMSFVLIEIAYSDYSYQKMPLQYEKYP